MSKDQSKKTGENLEILADNLKLLSTQYSVMGSQSDFLNERMEWFAKGLEEELAQRKMGIYPDFEKREIPEETTKAA